MLPQRAYLLQYDGTREGECSVDDFPELTLPQVEECKQCGATDADSTQHAWYPTFEPQMPQIRNIVAGLAKGADVVSAECFEEVRTRIRKIAGRSAWLPPGSHLGKFRFVLKSLNRPKKLHEKFLKLPDLFECGPNILLSSRAVCGLNEKGFAIPGNLADCTWNGLRREDYWAVELEPRAVFAPAAADAWNSWSCDFCGEGHLKQPIRRGGNPRQVEYGVNLFPEGTGMCRLRESFQLLVSRDFKTAVEALGLRGFYFIEGGDFVEPSAP